MNSGKKKNIEIEVEKTLCLLESSEDANVNPFFYTKLIARLNEPAVITAAPDFFDRVKFGVLIPVICALLLAVNIITLAIKYGDDGNEKKNELIQSIINHYDSLVGNSEDSFGNK